MRIKSVAVFGTFDTKGQEYAYLMEHLEKCGLNCVSIDLGTRGEPPFKPTIPATVVAEAGGLSLEQLKNEDRSKCLLMMATGTARICRRLCDENEIDGVIAIGGGQGTYMAGIVMREIPIGVPKLIVSTTATVAENSVHYIGINDTMIVNSLVDVSGLNPILRMILNKAAGAMAGMVEADHDLSKMGEKTPIGISMWGVTTPCVNAVQKKLEENGYEPFVFHTTGLGGRIMENLADSGFLKGVVDITLPELSIPIAGGQYPVIPFRLTKAGNAGIPQVVSFGGVDMISFFKPFDLPKKFKNRPYYMHNENLMFVRSTPRENELFADTIAERLNASKGLVKVLIPLKGLSAVDIEGNVMYDPEANRALFGRFKEKLRKDIEVVEMDCHINDPQFAGKAVELLMEMI
jgi:uncharacterized protein (UPF0261 family)